MKNDDLSLLFDSSDKYPEVTEILQGIKEVKKVKLFDYFHMTQEKYFLDVPPRKVPSDWIGNFISSLFLLLLLLFFFFFSFLSRFLLPQGIGAHIDRYP